MGSTDSPSIEALRNRIEEVKQKIHDSQRGLALAEARGAELEAELERAKERLVSASNPPPSKTCARLREKLESLREKAYEEELKEKKKQEEENETRKLMEKKRREEYEDKIRPSQMRLEQLKIERDEAKKKLKEILTEKALKLEKKQQLKEQIRFAELYIQEGTQELRVLEASIAEMEEVVAVQSSELRMTEPKQVVGSSEKSLYSEVEEKWEEKQSRLKAVKLKHREMLNKFNFMNAQLLSLENNEDNARAHELFNERNDVKRKLINAHLKCVKDLEQLVQWEEKRKQRLVKDFPEVVEITDKDVSNLFWNEKAQRLANEDTELVTKAFVGLDNELLKLEDDDELKVQKLVYQSTKIQLDFEKVKLQELKELNEQFGGE